MSNEDYAVVSAMLKYGGNFIQHLAKAMLAADATNFKKLKDAFPDYWDKYSGLAEKS